jgi:hypothetical protein
VGKYLRLGSMRDALIASVLQQTDLSFAIKVGAYSARIYWYKGKK